MSAQDNKIRKMAINQTMKEIKGELLKLKNKGRKLSKEELEDFEEYVKEIYEKNFEKYYRDFQKDFKS